MVLRVGVDGRRIPIKERLAMSEDYKVINLSGFLKTSKSSDSPIFGERVTVPKDCPEWLEDLACFGVAYSKGGLNNKDHYLLKTTYNEKDNKWYGKYLGAEPQGCNCG